MSIQWFPGHMTSARKKAGETLAVADVVVEVLDARLPQASSNPMIHELRTFRQRPCLKLLNKADLADPEATKAWLAHFDAQPGVKAVAISCKKAGDVAKIPGLAQKLAPHRNDAVKPLRLMIMGIPNVGKSTLMNALVKKKVAAVGDQPAVTKSQQRIDISNRLTLYDTPGMLWPKIDHPIDGLMLAASHAVGVNAYIDEEVATWLAGFLLEHYPALLKARYGIDAVTTDAVGVIETIARKRGCLIKGRGGEFDLEKAAAILLVDYRSGALGRITLETPALRAERQATLAAQPPAAVDPENP
ncbi:ribosome biogenesis GTPase YlqF [Dechloromonas sp.]|uniref:ribosome biogenesis GTPase YlqF n=1 Tax=Dechloromonas sp. TaxID=1917218 RepID=UPI0011FBA325|nr:ribosome biogenesis GTPase YlqF [Dechloromonas sp.]MBU3697941.1 ribosome biogenesis GTPase YlqF [Dechloromonas sp.]TEX50038.1 MAG: ribosome biogenesis GTPase YlqF [Rhodocyclaceae bacterium]